MSGHLEEGILNDLVDGLLSEAEEERARAHMAECVACRREIEGLQELRSELARMPDDAQPARDLWPQVAWRIGGEANTGRKPAAALRKPRTQVRAWQLVAASVAVALFSGGSVWLLMTDRSSRPDPVAEVQRPTLAIPASLEEAFGEYEKTVSGLETILEEGKDVLDPGTIQVLEENLALIDNAIDESREALNRDPGSGVLRRLLTENLLRKAALLRHAAVAVRAQT